MDGGREQGLEVQRAKMMEIEKKERKWGRGKHAGKGAYTHSLTGTRYYEKSEFAVFLVEKTELCDVKRENIKN